MTSKSQHLSQTRPVAMLGLTYGAILRGNDYENRSRRCPYNLRPDAANWEYVAVNHRGYLYAHQDGEYSFTAPIADNLSLLWLAPNAYSGYTRANANLEATYTPVGSAPLEYKVTLVKGKYYPIRFSWDNSGGAGYYELKIKAPDGTLIVDGTTTISPYLVKFGCRDT
ncbi:hypothetical protein VE01_04777 [Pseudogymnoascus verrucosus]|uniref:PA14 domain-containing protein n=1 Tax=Pseudogymnoascus verrucosus TaxID=342668 RepID=A0A1B8GMM1_9PEZI|nr:uncharacterized protein VE01_04777 [Pseudogymnoascus verrucosus]OBT97079.1 hypothetical protein VE01_04777 [Pseudogymnoascus verrucosus]